MLFLQAVNAHAWENDMRFARSSSELMEMVGQKKTAITHQGLAISDKAYTECRMNLRSILPFLLHRSEKLR